MNPSATRLAPRREIIIQINAISSAAQIIIDEIDTNDEDDMLVDYYD
jgi:hypothetical protein